MKSIKMKAVGFYLAVLFFALSAQGQAAEYQLNLDHTTIEFKIKHLFSWVKGTFNDYEGNFTFDENDIENSKVNVVIKSESIDTRNKQRDKHLRSADFFDVETFPELKFESTAVRKKDAQAFEVDGKLTIHGVEKAVTLDVVYHGEGTDPWGNTLSGFTATTQINRKDFGLVWNEVVETGQLLVGEEVLITIEVEGLKQ